ncbi:hypothetical protein COMNV_00669 [Commensalibacter sp. Nvir]|nr:hypothetical protein COMNV_00669 [Commensalibacter sp. Nvir]
MPMKSEKDAQTLPDFTKVSINKGYKNVKSEVPAGI